MLKLEYNSKSNVCSQNNAGSLIWKKNLRRGKRILLYQQQCTHYRIKEEDYY